jgi:hypothetical protein
MFLREFGRAFNIGEEEGDGAGREVRHDSPIDAWTIIDLKL